MKYIVWYFLISNATRAIAMLIMLAQGKYPRPMDQRTAKDDAFSMSVRVGFSIWAAFVLFGGRL